ncbi:MAG TPA: glycosyltransferase family 4 protein [Candidatus Saccharimonadales bacterium]
MKILFITRKFPPSTGGMELFAYDLSNALATKTEVKLIKWGGTGRVKAVLVAIPYLTLRAFFALLGGKIDVIHVQDGVLAPIGYLLSRLFRKPFTVVIHGLDLTFKNRLFRAVVPWSVQRASVVFCISQAAADEALRQGVATDKIQIIPLAVADKNYDKATRASLLKELKLPDDSKILLTVGRLVKRKGVAWFILHVLPGLVERYPKLMYVVVGEGVDRPEIEEAINASNMSNHVRLLGRVSDAVAAAAYNGADVFVMPNINVPNDVEGFGLVLLEASMCALPVVAANTEGIKDAVTANKNGVLVGVKDTEGFRREISHFLDNPKAAQKFGQTSRAFTQMTYRWDVLADRYIEQYRKLANRDQNP